MLLLQVTHDYDLAHTRSLLLKNCDRVVNCQPEGMTEAFRAGDFDGVIFCSTLSWDECQELLHSLREISPSTPVFRIGEEVGESDEELRAPADVVFLSQFVPAKVVKAIRTVDEQQHQAGFRKAQ